ncbi:MAG: ATP-binding protein [Mucilaginibacter sp.]|uniref:sensor histidine kinase n=1 Tax=Mucilaginibacter sp. TaxID=1882438 RepID=UPI003263E5B8
MQEVDHQVVTIIVAVLALLVFIVLVVLLLAVYYSNAKQKLIREKEILKTTYEKAILQAQFEIQEQTLRNASQEIHDNIGQVLSYVSLSLDRASGLDESSKNVVITESRALVNQSMNDLRDLSKSFSLDNIISNGLLPTIKAEVARLNKSRLIEAVINIEGSVYSIGEHQELVLFRILQEFVNNTLKHAKARHLIISLRYNFDRLTLSLNDDGVGFDFETQQNKNGSGLKNMRARAALIGAEVTAISEQGKGSQLIIQLDKAS